MFDYQRVTGGISWDFSGVPPSPPELQLVQPQRLKHVGPNSYRESTCLVAPMKNEEMYGKCVEKLGQIYGN